MDAPAPSNEDESELTESIETNFSQENKNYILRHSLSPTNIIFDIYSLDNQEIYEKEYSFNEIVKMNRYFLICESLKDIYDELSSLIENKKFSINLLNNEILLKFSLPSQKLKEVEFVLIKKNKVEEEDFTNLNKRIDKQDKVIRDQNIRICSLEYQLNNNSEAVKNLEEKIKNLEALLYDNININKDISVSKKKMIKINDNKNNVIKVNSNKYKIKNVKKEEEDISDDLTESNNNMINERIENKNIKNNINIQDNNNINKKDDKEEKKEKMNNISIDSIEDENNNDENINEDKDKNNKNDEESNNNEDNDEEEDSNNSEEKKINNNMKNNAENKINFEDNRSGEITDGINYNKNNNKIFIKKKDDNNDEKEYDSIEENNKEDDSYLGDKDNKEDYIEESSYTMDNNKVYTISGYRKVICKKVRYINFEESSLSYNTEENIRIIRHEDYKSSSIMKRINMDYNPDEEVNVNISNLEDFSVSENEENVIMNKLKKIIGRNCSLELVYQMIRDGNRTIDFHKKADIKSPTLVLFKTKDGYNFGGYTSKSFKSSGGWIKDPDSFLFNLNNMNKFSIKNGNENPAIFYGNASKYGPEFYDILINSGEVQYGTIYPANFINKVEDLKDGEADFTCKDVLVYRVNFM
jgi:hypothetical protein